MPFYRQIFSQLTLTLNCYSAMVSSWRHVISSVPEWKTHPNLAMTRYIRECSRNPPHSKVWNEAGTLALPPPMPKHKTVAYFPFPHQWCSIASERPSIKNCITQGPVHRFATLINLLVHAWYKCPAKVFQWHIGSWPEWDSNPRLHAYRAHALTTELSGLTMRSA